MYLRVIITDQIDDYTKEGWTFNLIDSFLVLDYYTYSTRKTKRHSWRAAKMYQRLHRPKDYDEPQKAISLEYVPLPDEVKVKALQKLMDQIEVIKEMPR